MINPIYAQESAFEPIDHTYIYDIQEDGGVRCTWSTTILPKEPIILYTFSFHGGETEDYLAEDFLGQELDPDVNEQDGQRTVSLLLSGYNVSEPYQFNLSFTWYDLLTHKDDRHTLYTSVNVGDPQAAEIVIIPPAGAKIGTSMVTRGNSTELFQMDAVNDRDAMVWRTNNTGNETEIVFRANFNYQSDLMDSGGILPENLMPESLYGENDLYAISSQANQPISFAFPAEDINGDSAVDFLVLNISSDPITNGFKSDISAMSGSDGVTIWQKEYPDGLAIAYPVGDLNGDGLGDVVIDVVIAGMDFIPSSEVAALHGCNGTEIWSSPQLLAGTVAYPIKDLTGDNATDLVVHLFGIDSLNSSLVTKISSVDGYSGIELDSRVFPGAVAAKYPAGNLTSDEVQDSITAVYRIDETSPENITSIIAASDGSDREELWNASFNESLAIAVPVSDISGDSLDDLLVYMMSNDTTITFEMAAIQGTDGQMLWRRSSGDTLAIAFAGPDLTGDGTRDLIVYKLSESGESETEAVKGDDGSLLWTKPSMVFVPQ